MVTMNSETSVKAFSNASNSPPSPEAEPITNAIMQALIKKGNALKNFGQCIIFMLNRERPHPFLVITDRFRRNVLTIINFEIIIFDIHHTTDVRVFLQ
jgi:hypothetical protein